jgi:hypothetical protein
MSDTRKAIVTTAQVQAELDTVNEINVKVGLPVVGVEFDKGARGKGFALYSKEGVAVQSFETKEAAYNLFATYVQVADTILTGSNVSLVTHAIEEQIEAALETPAPVKTTRKAAEKVSA